MRNPMTPEDQCKAVMDNAAGYPMQYRQLPLGGDWIDRANTMKGQLLNFAYNEYRRKPEPIIMYANIYKIGAPACHSSLADAKESKVEHFVRHVRLIEDPDWVEPEPAPTPKNPWRPIIKGKFPECWSGSQIMLRWENMDTLEQCAEHVMWSTTGAIEWKYAEDE